jgi:mono/diheme cytochrome c family protein
MGMVRSILGCVVVLLLCSLTTGAQAMPTSPALIEQGKAIYSMQCATCHGAQGKGDGPAAVAFTPKPRNFTAGTWTAGGAPSQVFMTITKGLPGTSMAPFESLPVTDRWALTHYIRTFDPNPVAESPATLAASGLDTSEAAPAAPTQELPVDFAIERLVDEAATQ